MDNVVTRFAPSPTGHLHIGGARTAIFSWLLARGLGGTFLLRIEDTDRERSQEEMTQGILDSLTWLGLTWDADPVYQSQRADRHNEAIDRLLAEGKAYWCECTPEEVEAMREEARAKGEKPKYNGRCRERGLGPGEGRVVRFKTPLDGVTVFDDLVRGRTAWNHAELDDMILRRPDGSPTYNLAVVVDDHEMGVTHVLRGDDHVNNTPRQILLYKALGWDIPVFGHVPMILGADKKKLSKRHGARSVVEYREEGILPAALFNYLLRLGWSHGDQELFTMEELLNVFSTEGLSRSPAAFDPDKLLWVNAQYIQNSAPQDLVGPLSGYLEVAGLPVPDKRYLTRMIPLYQPRAKTMIEMAQACRYLVLPAGEVEYDPKAVEKFLTSETRELLSDIRSLFVDMETFEPAGLEEAVKAFIEARGLKFKAIAQPLRVALTGGTASPGLFEMMEILGQEETLRRLDRVVLLESSGDGEGQGLTL